MDFELLPKCARARSMPDQEYYGGEQVLMLGVDIGPKTEIGPPEQALSLLQTLKITYPAVTTADERVQDEYTLRAYPPPRRRVSGRLGQIAQS